MKDDGDLDAYFRFYTEQIHKYWGYFQIVAAALLGYCWGSNPFGDSDGFVILGLIVAFLAFSIVNRQLLIEAEHAAIALWARVQAREISAQRPVINSMQPFGVTRVFISHAILSLAVIAGIGASAKAIRLKIIELTGYLADKGLWLGVMFVAVVFIVSMTYSASKLKKWMNC